MIQRNEVSVYPEARFVYRSDLGCYCLMRCNTLEFSAAILGSWFSYLAPSRTHYLGPIRIKSDSPKPLEIAVTSLSPELTVSVSSFENSDLFLKLDVAPDASSEDGDLIFRIVATLPGGANIETEVHCRIPLNEGIGHTLFSCSDLTAGSLRIYGSGSQEGIPSSLDGLNWTLEPVTITQTEYPENPDFSTQDTIQSCLGSGGTPIFYSYAGWCLSGGSWKTIKFAIPGGNAPENQLQRRYCKKLIWDGSSYIGIFSKIFRNADVNTADLAIIATSPDLITWTSLSSDELASRDNSSLFTSAGTTIAYLEGTFFRRGSDGVFTGLEDLWTPNTGVPPQMCSDGEGRWLALLDDSVFYSENDGVNWSSGTAPFTGMTRTIFFDGNFIIVSATQAAVCPNPSFNSGTTLNETAFSTWSLAGIAVFGSFLVGTILGGPWAVTSLDGLNWIASE